MGVEVGMAVDEAAAVTAGSDGHRGRHPRDWVARESLGGRQPFVPPAVRPATRFFCTR